MDLSKLFLVRPRLPILAEKVKKRATKPIVRSSSEGISELKSSNNGAGNGGNKAAVSSSSEGIRGASIGRRSIYSLSQTLRRQRSLRILIEKFKQFSESSKFRRNRSIYYDVTGRLAAAGDFAGIEEILEYQKQYDDISIEGFNGRLIALYGRSGMYHLARKVFDEMPDRNCQRTVFSFNCLLGASLHSNMYEECCRLFNDLPKELGIEPDAVSYGTLMKIVCKGGGLDLGVSFLFKMEDRGVTPNEACYNIVLDGLYTNRKLVLGDRIWGCMLEKNVLPNVVSYTSKAVGCALVKGDGDSVVELMEEMIKEGIEPDGVFFEALIHNFVQQNDLEEARRWYREARMRKMKLKKGVFEALIPLACEKGNSTFAFEIAKDVFFLKCVVDAGVLQRVVECLAKDSRIEEAEEVVRLGKENEFCLYRLKL